MRMLLTLLMLFLPRVASAQQMEPAIDPAALEAAIAAEPIRPNSRVALLTDVGIGGRARRLPPQLTRFTQTEAVTSNGLRTRLAPGLTSYMVISGARTQLDGSVVVFLQRRVASRDGRLGGADIQITVIREETGWRAIGRQVVREY